MLMQFQLIALVVGFTAFAADFSSERSHSPIQSPELFTEKVGQIETGDSRPIVVRSPQINRRALVKQESFAPEYKAAREYFVAETANICDISVAEVGIIPIGREHVGKISARNAASMHDFIDGEDLGSEIDCEVALDRFTSILELLERAARNPEFRNLYGSDLFWGNGDRRGRNLRRSNSDGCLYAIDHGAILSDRTIQRFTKDLEQLFIRRAASAFEREIRRPEYKPLVYFYMHLFSRIIITMNDQRVAQLAKNAALKIYGADAIPRNNIYYAIACMDAQKMAGILEQQIQERVGYARHFLLSLYCTAQQLESIPKTPSQAVIQELD